MNVSRLLAACAVVCLIGAGARAADKTNYAKMLVGKWEVSKADPDTVPVGSVVEFTKNGKFKVVGKKDDKEMAFEGTYTVKDNTFTFKIKNGDQEHSETITITKISKSKMTTNDKDGKSVELTKK